MALNQLILEIIACPICKGKLHYNHEQEQLICKFDKISFPIRNGVPIMLITCAKPIDIDELKKREKIYK